MEFDQMFYTHKGSADRKSSYLYTNLPVNTKMAFLSRKLILLAILLHVQFIHHTQISLYPNKQCFSLLSSVLIRRF